MKEWPEILTLSEELLEAWSKLSFAKRQIILYWKDALAKELLNQWVEINLEEVRKTCADLWRNDFPEVDKELLES